MTTTKFLFANNASSRLAAPILSTDLSLSVTAGGGVLFPAPGAGQYFSLSISDAGTGLLREIMHVTNVTGDVFTVVRGQEGTTAKAYAFNDPVANLWTAGQAAIMAQNPSDALGCVSAVQIYAGNPNGHIAGNAAVVGTSAPSMVWDTTDQIFWVCIGTGTTSTAAWLATGSPGATTYCGTSTGSANAQVVTPAVPVTLAAGLSLAFIAGFTNSTAMTLNASGTGVRNVFKESPTGPIALTGGEVVAGNLISVRLDGTQYQLTATELGTAALANASSNTGTVAAVSGGITVGHLAVFSDTQGTIVDGGLPGTAAAPTYLNHSNNGNTLGTGVFIADTSTGSGGAFTVNLPAAPASGNSIELTDIFGTWGTNNLTLGRNGKTIMGLAEDLVCNVSGLVFKIEYNGTDWRLQ